MNIESIILIILFVMYFYYSYQGDGKRNIRRFITCGCVLLGLEAGLRHISVGPDTPTYYTQFELVLNTSWSEVFSGFEASANDFRDPAYALIVKAFSSIIPSWQCFLVVVAFFFFFSLWRVLTRYITSLDGALLAFVLYLSLFNIVALSGLRQCITTGIAFLIIPLINDNRWFIAVPIVLAGATIHISLLFMLLLIPLMTLSDRVKKLTYFISIILIPVIAIGARSIITYMVGFLSNDYYAVYANADEAATPIVYVVLCSLISIYEYFNNDKLIAYDATKFLLASNILMTLCVPLIFLDGTMIRIGQYFTLYMMVSLPLIFDQTTYRKMAYICSIVFLSYRVFASESIYHFFWEYVPGFLY